MRRITKSVFALACISLLATQFSGSHLHADTGEHDGQQAHSPHLQQSYSQDQDHNGAHVDVSVFEPASGFSKGEVFVASHSMPALVELPASESRWQEPALLGSLNDDIRWRPPLRAPPIRA